MLIRLLRMAIVAGMLSGVLLTVGETVFLEPVILNAEKYEKAADDEPNAAQTIGIAGSLVSSTSVIPNPEPEWAPETGWERNFYTGVFNVASAFAASLIMGAALNIMRNIRWWHGLFWGLGGFVAFFAAPGIIYPPSLPGAAEAHLVVRQLWWVATIESTLFGLAFLVFARQYAYRIMGFVLLFAPHIVGGPPGTVVNLAPEALSIQFIWVSISLNVLFWLILGLITTTFFCRFVRGPSSDVSSG